GMGAVDHHRLLVVTVEGVLTRIRLTADAGPAHERLDGLPHLGPRGVKGRNRSSGPDQDSDLDAFGEFGQERAEHAALTVTFELESGGHVPAGDVDGLTGLAHR